MEGKSKIWQLIDLPGPAWLHKAFFFPAMVMIPIWFGPYIIVVCICKLIGGNRKLGESKFSDAVYVIGWYLQTAIIYASGALLYCGLFLFVREIVRG